MNRTIKNIEDRYLDISAQFVENVFTDSEGKESARIVKQLVLETRSKRFYLPELELIMVDDKSRELIETELYDTDMEVRNLIDWICVSEQIKTNNNTIRNLTGEYKKIEPDCREGESAVRTHERTLQGAQ